MKAFLVFLVLVFLVVGCQAEDNMETVDPKTEISEEVVVLQEEGEESANTYHPIFDLFGKTQEEILELYEEVPQLIIEEGLSGAENASGLLYPGENMAFFFSKEKEMEEIFIAPGTVFLGFEIKEVLEEDSLIDFFGEPDERVFFRNRHAIVYYMNGGDVLFVKETEVFGAYVSVFPPPEE